MRQIAITERRHIAPKVTGRAFIRTYYSVSPLLIKCFGDHRGFSFLARHLVSGLVARLQKSGVSRSRYNAG